MFEDFMLSFWLQIKTMIPWDSKQIFVIFKIKHLDYNMAWSDNLYSINVRNDKCVIWSENGMLRSDCGELKVMKAQSLQEVSSHLRCMDSTSHGVLRDVYNE